jgi:hypothetical protein
LLQCLYSISSFKLLVNHFLKLSAALAKLLHRLCVDFDLACGGVAVAYEPALALVQQVRVVRVFPVSDL